VQNVLDTLLEMEKNARTCEAVAETDNTFEEISRGTTALEQQAATRLATIQQNAQIELEARLSQITADYAQKTEAMEAEFANNHKAWLEKIVQSVLYP